MSVKALGMQHLTIIYHNGHAHRVNFMFMSKNDAFNLIKNSRKHPSSEDSIVNVRSSLIHLDDFLKLVLQP